MGYKDDEVQKQYQREHYLANKVAYKENRLWRVRVLRRINQELKSTTPCTDCGNLYSYYVMQWDHLPGFEKRYDPSAIRAFGSVTGFLEELDKCELVCANCHAERTYSRGETAPEA